MSGQSFLQFLLLCLFSYRLQRVVTSDTWPPSEWFRKSVDSHYGPSSSIAEFINCSWCIGGLLTIAVFSWAAYLINVPLPVLQTGAAMSVVGYLSSKESD